MEKRNQRTVICLATNGNPEVIFGPFDEPKEAETFIDKHVEVCGLKHIVRRIVLPKFGVKENAANS